MEKIKELCKYSHDYDGFMYVEDDCYCALCKKGKQYILLQELTESRDYEIAGGDKREIVLEGENLNKTLADLCISDWAKTYKIRENDSITMVQHIEGSEKAK